MKLLPNISKVSIKWWKLNSIRHAFKTYRASENVSIQKSSYVKIAGAINLDIKSIICEIMMESGTVYKIRSFLKNAKLIEFNENI